MPEALNQTGSGVMSLEFRNPEEETASVLRTTRASSLRPKPKVKPSLKVSPQEVSRTRSRARKAKKKGWSFLGFAAICLVVVGAGGGLLAVNTADGAFKTELEADKAIGLIVDPKQIKEIANIPADQNGARAYAGAFSVLQASKVALKAAYPKGLTFKAPELAGQYQRWGIISSQIIEGKASAGDIELARGWLGHEQDVLGAYRNAAAFPHVFFDRDYTFAAATNLSEYGPMREGANQLLLEAALGLKDGNFELARKDLIAASRISVHIGEDPPLIAGLVQAGLQSSIYRVANAILATRCKDARALQLVDDVLDQLGEPLPFSKMLRFESLLPAQIPEAAQLSLVKDPRVWSEENQASGPDYRMLAVPGVGAAVARLVLEGERHQMEIALRQGDNYVGLVSDLAALGKRQHDSGLIGRLADSFTGFFAETPLILADLAAKRRLLAQGLKVAKVHAKTGEWLSGLPLSGKYAIDPHSNQPLKWASDSSGFLVWSVGRNRLDDGGFELSRQSTGVDTSRPDDISIRVGHPFPPPRVSGSSFRAYSSAEDVSPGSEHAVKPGSQ